MYERITQEPDQWGYVDAHSTSHWYAGFEWPITGSFPAGASPPLGHPLWCADNGRPLLIQKFQLVFSGQHDNHPLRDSDNGLAAADSNVVDTLFDLAIPFLDTINILRNSRVLSDDWTGTPNTPERKNCRFLTWKYEQEVTHNPDVHQTYTTIVPPPSPDIPVNRRVLEDKPATWVDQPLGATTKEEEYFETNYPNPYHHPEDRIAFSLWVPQIVKLRRACERKEDGIRGIIQHLLSPEMRPVLDALDDQDGTLHYFHHHCIYFRLIDTTVSFVYQGFICESHVSQNG